MSSVVVQKAKHRPWRESFELLKDFKGKHGHCRVPSDFAGDPKLFDWVSTQPYWRKKGTLSAEQLASLDGIGFDWDWGSADMRWNSMYQRLESFKKEHGNCEVPESVDTELFGWINRQREHQLNTGRLRADRKAKLDLLEFPWADKALANKWQEKYTKLVDYKTVYGHCNVPRSYKEDTSLVEFVYKQRCCKQELTDRQRALLDEIGFVWNPCNDVAMIDVNGPRPWRESFELLKDFKEKHGHCRVPGDFADSKLFDWVFAQRCWRKKGTLSTEQLASLDGIGFDWGSADMRWNSMYQRLESFKKEHGNCEVPESFDTELFGWIHRQREHQLNRGLRADRKAKLDLLEFPWADQALAKRWQEKYTQLVDYKAIHGHCNVPFSYKENASLARFVRDQRLIKQELTDRQLALLDGIGFVWDLRDLHSGATAARRDKTPRRTGDVAMIDVNGPRRWRESFALLKDFKEKHGHCRVPGDFADDPKLYRWVTVQRSLRKKNKLTAEQLASLDGIGFDWDWGSADMRWNSMYQRLESFKKEHGNCEVPESVDTELFGWINRQREDQLNRGLRADRKAKLDLLEFPWADKALAKRWQEKYTKLVEYKAVHGHCYVPYSYEEDTSLGQFVYVQRRCKQELTDRQRALLDEIGFEWVPRSRRSSQSAGEPHATIAPTTTEARRQGATAAGGDVSSVNNEMVFETPRRTDNVTIMLDVDELASKKKKTEDGGGERMPVEEVRYLGQARTAADHESDNGEGQHPVGDFVPRSVYERDLAGVKRKYKTKALRYYDERNKLKREVKRLRVELQKVQPGSHLLVPDYEGVAV